MDSLLGDASGLRDASDGMGLTRSYRELVEEAFVPKFWRNTTKKVGGYTQAELNFSMFFGIAVMMYEALLVSGPVSLRPLDGGRRVFGGGIRSRGAAGPQRLHGRWQVHQLPQWPGDDQRLRAECPEGQQRDRGDGHGERRQCALRQRLLQHRRHAHDRRCGAWGRGPERQAALVLAPDGVPAPRPRLVPLPGDRRRPGAGGQRGGRRSLHRLHQGRPLPGLRAAHLLLQAGGGGRRLQGGDHPEYGAHGSVLPQRRQRDAAPGGRVLQPRWQLLPQQPGRPGPGHPPARPLEPADGRPGEVPGVPDRRPRQA